MAFDAYIGIDYSGAQKPDTRQKGLQVYLAQRGELQCMAPPQEPKETRWTMREAGEWLVEQCASGLRVMAGLDHTFSFPVAYFRRRKLGSWDAFLDDFVENWPTHQPGATVAGILKERPLRTGRADQFRLTERWTSSARSVFQFKIAGGATWSTHAGIPWLWHIRRQLGPRVHFWPFDGWELPADESAIVEVYPSILRHRYPRADRGADEQDAYAIARWLKETVESGHLVRYLQPPLADAERRVAELEGWILGIA